MQRFADSALPPANALDPALHGPPERTAPARVNRTGLPDRLKAGIEMQAGIALDDVRVHRHSPHPARIGALAYAQGSQIHLGPGQERHLPHEAWHVVQQKQGRVRATRQLKGGVAVNDHAGLEAEADAMGARALRPMGAANAKPPAFKLVSAGPKPPLQAVWVIRGGSWKWIEENQRQKGDETPPDFEQRPELVLPGGEESATPDHTGAMNFGDRDEIDKYTRLAERRKAQGAKLRARLLKNPKAIQGHIDDLDGIANNLEKTAPNSLPDDHKGSMRSMMNKTTLKSSDFRTVIGGQDEYTQSSGSANFLNGLKTPHPSESGEHKKLLDDYSVQAARVMSGLRAPTQSIVAPIERDGQMLGMRHPTTDDQPGLEGGASAHAYNDRLRSQRQADVFDAADQDDDAPPNAVFNAANLTGALATLHHMSWPTTASNVAPYHPTRANQQVDERDVIKVQAAVMGQSLGIRPRNDRQQSTAPLTSYHDRPTSPYRSETGPDLLETLGIPRQTASSSPLAISSSSPPMTLHQPTFSSVVGSSATALPPSPYNGVPPPFPWSVGRPSHGVNLGSMALFGDQGHLLADNHDMPDSWKRGRDDGVMQDDAMEEDDSEDLRKVRRVGR